MYNTEVMEFEDLIKISFKRLYLMGYKENDIEVIDNSENMDQKLALKNLLNDGYIEPTKSHKTYKISSSYYNFLKNENEIFGAR